MKQIQAIAAAIAMTILIGLCMLAVGVNAALNPNTVPINDTPLSALAASSQVDSTGQANDVIAQYQAQIQQLNNQITQYQNREKQYQQQLNQLNSTNQQLQNVLNELQRRGIIRIMSDGSIQLRRGGE